MGYESVFTVNQQQKQLKALLKVIPPGLPMESLLTGWRDLRNTTWTSSYSISFLSARERQKPSNSHLSRNSKPMVWPDPDIHDMGYREAAALRTASTPLPNTCYLLNTTTATLQLPPSLLFKDDVIKFQLVTVSAQLALVNQLCHPQGRGWLAPADFMLTKLASETLFG